MDNSKLAAALQQNAVRQVRAQRKVRRDVRIKMQTINLFCEVKLLMMTPTGKARLMEGR